MGNGITDGGWRYAAASVIGTSHKTSPEGVCQDAFRLEYLEHARAFIGVVADGAGSASHSQVGSRCTCDLAVQYLSEAAPGSLVTADLAKATLAFIRAELQRLADQAGLRMRDFACTMLVAVICEEQVAFWQIGDGAICFRQPGSDRFDYAFWPEKGDYANVTYFVTDANANEHLEIDIADTAIADLAMFSDGLERLALNFATGEAHTPFFDGLFPHIRSLPGGYCARTSADIAKFLDSERVNKRTDDDKTLILASRLA